MERAAGAVDTVPVHAAAGDNVDTVADGAWGSRLRESGGLACCIILLEYDMEDMSEELYVDNLKTILQIIICISSIAEISHDHEALPIAMALILPDL